ncbi:MAG TPA: DUF559 domain-containing protein [Solirubrobacterales bacterium]|nr:DUF559 domain-containing protein [Solirubrobacterales bacterium]
MLPHDQYAAALRQAEYLRLPRHELESDHTRSELERGFLNLCRRHRLPSPEVNASLGGYVVDFLWREPRLIVVVDGWDSHHTRSAFEADRARDAHLATLGFRVLRFTWRQLTEQPREVAATVRVLLARG